MALPLILSTSSLTLMHVIDRMFLSWYSPDALAASLPAGATSFAFISLFFGTAGYVGTFIAQYDGAGLPRRIGPVLWQSVYFSAASSLLLLLAAFVAAPLFGLFGHPPPVLELEIRYFIILTAFGGGEVFGAALSSFYSGRGKTWVVMWCNLAAVAVNFVLDYGLIFGRLGFPAWGIVGAATATVAASWLKAALFAVLILLPRNRERFDTWRGRRFDGELMRRLLRFGLPSGAQFMIDVLAFSLFILLVGRLGRAELAATNLAFTVNSLLFMPMLGMHVATSVLVGRYQGMGRTDWAERSTRSAIRLTMLYMLLFSVALVVFPGVFIDPFLPEEAGEEYQRIAALARLLLLFVAGYSVIDAANLIYSAALKGAGDTAFVMRMLLIVASLGLALPSYLVCVVWPSGIYAAWGVLTAYVFALAAAFYLRYRGGAWKSMRVIEHAAPCETGWSDGPLVETVPSSPPPLDRADVSPRS